MNQVSALEAQTQQRSLNSSLGNILVNPLVHLSCQLLTTVARLFTQTHLRSRRSPLSTMARGAPYLPRR
ncbi:hypothetical protein TNCV_2245131 [Trichonephila clavipes]|nr:hypothetical protein TNCV_2245131 [Trichonephila clavipes]